MDGLDATRKIRSSTDPKVRDVKVIALTANAIVGDRERCISAGMNSYLTKVRGPQHHDGCEKEKEKLTGPYLPSRCEVQI